MINVLLWVSPSRESRRKPSCSIYSETSQTSTGHFSACVNWWIITQAVSVSRITQSLTSWSKSSLLQCTSVRRSVIKRVDTSKAIIRSIHNLSRYRHNLLSLIFQKLSSVLTLDALFLLIHDLSCNVKLHLMLHFVSSLFLSLLRTASLITEFMMIAPTVNGNRKSRMSFPPQTHVARW